MAKQPNDAVQFTYESAERIASVVRAAELTPPATRPLSFEPFFDVRKIRQVRAGTFSGSWNINVSKVVTLTNVPTATATVMNLSWPITHNHTAPEPCIVGKDGTSWYLVVPKLEAKTAVFATQTQAGTNLVSIAIAATLNTNNCSITVSQTPTTSLITLLTQTATATYLRLRVP